MGAFFWNDDLEKYECKDAIKASDKVKKTASTNAISTWVVEAKDRQDGRLIKHITLLRDKCFQNALDAGWHTDLGTGELIERNKAEMLMLIVSEVAEAMEGVRKDLKDDHLPERSMEEVELADTVIRIMDYAGRWGLDIGGAIIEKLEYNKNRADHKIENRIKNGGKKF